ncbi:MAG: sulfurtransferase-like selenium metabolism protein YedF [Desulfobacteraceae bacterium]|nr:MAG: sulfurtransferase-like selenium metabolism protein YedF [Desulfobacteraceae bacterium]
MKEIDARGLSCPAPVLHTKAVLEQENPDAIRVLLDNAASQQNVQRFLKSQGFETALAREGEGFTVVGTGRTTSAPQAHPTPAAVEHEQKIMVMCANDRIGSGDDELGRRLMVNFIRTLPEMGTDLWRLIFVNNGVRLTVEGSPVLEELKQYEEKGISILACGTCLEHFKLMEKRRVGQTTNMLDIATAMQLADKVINL